MEARPTTGAIAYAPPLPQHRRRLRRWSLAMAAAALLVLSYWWGPRASYRARLSYFQWRCARHAAPPDPIIYSEYPPDVQQMASAGTGYQPGPAGTGAVFSVPDDWSDFYGSLYPPGFRSRGTAFLHERRTPSGWPLLVSVDYLGDVFHHSGYFSSIVPSSRCARSIAAPRSTFRSRSRRTSFRSCCTRPTARPGKYARAPASPTRRTRRTSQSTGRSRATVASPA